MNLFIGNLNPETTVTNLRKIFSEFGEIVSIKIIYDNATGMSRGFGFVEMGDKFMAFDAIDNLDATFFEGNIISVKEAKQNNTKPGGPKKGRPRTSARPGMKFNPNQNRPQGPNRFHQNDNPNRTSTNDSAGRTSHDENPNRFSHNENPDRFNRNDNPDLSF